MNNNNDNDKPAVEFYVIVENEIFPNNETLPVLFYHHAFSSIPGHVPAKDDEALAELIERTFKIHEWENSWRNGIYDYHHYHSTAHEVLAVYSGNVHLQLGGDHGLELELSRGDVLVLPAGVAHKNLGSDKNFKCIGAYPVGQKYDINYGKAKERPRADRNIAKVPLPTQDPVYGNWGPVRKYWNHL